MKKVVLIGDSIRLGYQEYAEKALQDWAELHCPEMNGGPSPRVLEHLDEWALSLKPDIVHINAGLHDIARLEENQHEPRVSEEQYRENVTQILLRLKDNTQALIIWALTTPVIDKRHHEVKKFDRNNADVIKRNEIATEICNELGVPTNDLYAFVMNNNHETMLGVDGVHFTDEAKAMQGAEVARVIRELSK